MTTLSRLADLVVNRPLLLSPDKLAVIVAALDGRLGIDASNMPPAPDASRFVGSRRDQDGALTYARTNDGVAVISMVGSLVNRGAWVGASSGLVSYEGLCFQLRQAGVDPKVRAVVLDIESGGGQATGAFETARAVRDLAAQKPVTAVVNGMAASAAYAIASAATRVVTTESGLSGSIGVVLLHVDRSGAMQKAGLRPTLIHAGAHKVDANPYGPLSAEVRDDLQGEVNLLLEMFVSCVTAGRKNLSAAAVRGTEARIFMGAEAVRIGLADRTGTFEDALAEAARTTRLLPTRARGGANMRTTMDEDERRIRAEERTRISSIMSSEQAQGRQSQALALACETDLNADQVSRILAASPKVSGRSSLQERMENRTEFSLDPEKPTGAERQERQAERAKGLDPSAIYGARRAASQAASDNSGSR